MKYIVWDLISPYDGYATTNHTTWEEVKAYVKSITEQPWHNSDGVKKLYNDWLDGKVDSICNDHVEIFVTSERLTGPINI